MIDKYSNVNYKIDALDNKADYVLDNNGTRVGIQRKEVNDFIGSIGDLKDTMYELRENHDISILLIEGNWKIRHGKFAVRRGSGWYLTSYSSKSFRNFMFSQFTKGSTMYRSTNLGDTVKSLIQWHGYLEKPISAPTTESSPDQIIPMFPKIGPKKANRIIEEFGSVYGAITNIDEWDSVKGIGEKTLEEVKEWLGGFDE